MDDVVDALHAQRAELAGYVEHAGRDELLRPSRCDGWTVADVLLHLAQTDEMAVASVQGRLPEFAAEVAGAVGEVGSVDAWAGAVVDLERGDPEAARDRWLAASDAQIAAFAAADPGARLLWVAGELAARTLASTRLTECWIHTVDVAVAFGPEPPPTRRLWHTARLAWRTLPYAFAGAGRHLAGPVAFELVAPDGSTWEFGTDAAPVTVIRGSAHDLCTVAGQRADAADTGLTGTGPDAHEVLALVRTFA